MIPFIKELDNLRNSKVKMIVDTRLNEFENNKRWFSELCFCILTANSRAKTAINIQNEIKQNGFLKMNQSQLTEVIKRNKHRFHNNKAKYIVEARKYKEIKKILNGLDEYSAREWLVKNIKGVGYKEASHFLRNVGYKNLSILDRHILNLMFENNYISNIPKPLTKSKYLEIEKTFLELSHEVKMCPAELDLYMWYLKTGEILK